MKPEKKEDGGQRFSLCGKTTVELHLISRSKHSPAKREDGAFNDHSASRVSDVQLDCSSHGRQDSHLINSNPQHFPQTGEQEPGEGKERGGERMYGIHGEKACVPRMLLLSLKAGRQMGAVRRLDGGGQAGTGVFKHPSPHERTSRPTRARRAGGRGVSVIDVPCDWSLRHAYADTTPRPGRRSR